MASKVLLMWAMVLCRLTIDVSMAQDACAAADVCTEDVSAPSMLMKSKAIRRHLVSNGTCAPLVLPGFTQEGCESLAPGASCKVSCLPGLTGEPVRYFCFSAMAARGEPPAALAAPVCFNSSVPEYTQDKVLPLTWGGKGCLHCPGDRQICSKVLDAGPGDERCTLFKFDLGSNRIRWNENPNKCLYISSGPGLGLWSCKSNDDFWFHAEPSSRWRGAEALCVSSRRGTVCVESVRAPSFFDTAPDASLLRPALEAMAAGDNQTFFQQAYAVQICRGRLESALPDSFWEWLQAQDAHMLQALFATFPVHPGQLRRFYDIREAVGHDRFDALGMASFAIALSYVNRLKFSLDEAIQFPKPNYEYNGATRLAGEEEERRVRQEMINGEHCHLQSNECRDLHRCCGAWQNWSFAWPRDPTPTTRDWVEWWLNKTSEHPTGLWMNPLREVPWMFGVYLFPSPLKECDWVHRKLIDGEPMEGSWYYYYSSFHLNVCAGGDYHPDSLMGIAVYGGVCGRMSQLAWRKASCMGTPSAQKGEPGHSASFQFHKQEAIWSTFNVITDVSDLVTLEVVQPENPWVWLELAKNSDAFPDVAATCLKCRSWRRCTSAVAGSTDCTPFRIDAENHRIVAKHNANQCLTLRGGPRADLTKCWWGHTGTSQDVTTNDANETVIAFGSRGTLRFRATSLPQEPQVGCLVCTTDRQPCTFAAPNSTECSKFEFDEEAQLIRIAGLSGKCVDILTGPRPGVWSCSGSGSANQLTSVTEEGHLLISSGRGHVRFHRSAAVADTSEHGRCIICPPNAYTSCSFGTAGSSDCSEFAFDPSAQQLTLVVSTRKRCLHICDGQLPCTASCNGDEHERVTADATGRLKFMSSRGKMFLHVPNGGQLPQLTTRWMYKGVHEIECTKSKCHFTSVMGLDSQELFYKRHKEAALAAIEAWNNYETHGLYPTAHDEARLAASMVFALKRDAVVPDGELMPLLTWALRRNPALFDTWELAADFPLTASNESIPSRETLATHEWYRQLAALSLEAAPSKAPGAADAFAREHLAGKRQHWLQLPQLHRSLVGRLCGALSDGMLGELGEASEQCLLVRRLAADLGWQDVESKMLSEDTRGERNMPSETFLMHWEALVRLASGANAEAPAERLTQLLEALLGSFTVGYINERSQTFFAEHQRVLLRSPYAHLLELAGLVLPKFRREELMHNTVPLLQLPFTMPDRMHAVGSADLKWDFLEWAAQHHHRPSGALEESSISDSVNGFHPDDQANPEVMGELLRDMDAGMELGSGIFQGGGEEDAERETYSPWALLRGLLRLPANASDEVSLAAPELAEDHGSGRRAAAALLRKTASSRFNEVQGLGGPTPLALMQQCIDDVLDAKSR